MQKQAYRHGKSTQTGCARLASALAHLVDLGVAPGEELLDDGLRLVADAHASTFDHLFKTATS